MGDAHHHVCQILQQGDLGPPTKSRTIVLEESADEVESARAFLVENMISRPQINFVRTKQLAVAIVLHSKHKVHEWLDAGIVLPAEVEDLLHPLHHSLGLLPGLTEENNQRKTAIGKIVNGAKKSVVAAVDKAKLKRSSSKVSDVCAEPEDDDDE